MRQRLVAALTALVGSAGWVAGVATAPPWDRSTVVFEIGTAWDSNTGGNADSGSGWVHTARAEAELERSRGWISLVGRLGLEGTWVVDENENTSLGPVAALEAQAPLGQGETLVRAEYARRSVVDRLVANRLTLETASARARHLHPLGRGWRAGLEGGWSQEEADTPGFGRQTTRDASARIGWSPRNGFEVYSGWEWRRRSTSLETADREDNLDGWIVGLDGAIPLTLFRGLVLTARGGYRRSTSGTVPENRYGGLALEGEAEWELTPLTRLSLSGGRDTVTTLEGSAGTQTEVRARLQHRLGDRWTARAEAARAHRNLDPPQGSAPATPATSEDSTEFSLGLDYALAGSFRLGLSASRVTSDSTSARRDYVQERLALTIGYTR